MFVCRNFQKNKQGFTLIELLTSVIIFSFLSGAVYVSLAQGLRIWKAATHQTLDWKQDLFVEEIRSDLRNAFVRKGPALNGSSAVLKFYTMLPDVRRAAKTGDTNRIPAQVTYRFDGSQKAIMKETAFYEKILHPGGKEGVHLKKVMENIGGIRFEYFKNPKEKVTAASWQAKWNDGCLPEAVKMTLETNDSRVLKKVYIFNLASQGVCPETRRV